MKVYYDGYPVNGFPYYFKANGEYLCKDCLVSSGIQEFELHNGIEVCDACGQPTWSDK